MSNSNNLVKKRLTVNAIKEPSQSPKASGWIVRLLFSVDRARRPANKATRTKSITDLLMTLDQKKKDLLMTILNKRGQLNGKTQ